MHINLLKIHQFYQGDIGHYVTYGLTSKVQKFCQSFSKEQSTIIASAGAAEYYGALQSHAVRLGFQIYDDGEIPTPHDCGYIRTERAYWPYRAEDVDGVVMVHDIEFAENPEVYLREIWRVLKGEGQLFIVIPNRSGGWARADNNPFGQGHPYSLDQMRKILANAHFQIDTVDRALFFPPYEPKTSIGRFYRRMLERIGGVCMLNGGVLVLTASKHIYAPTRGLREMTAAGARTIIMNKTSGATSSRCPKVKAGCR